MVGQYLKLITYYHDSLTLVEVSTTHFESSLLIMVVTISLVLDSLIGSNRII
eukprot:SAG11_NODE_170_length_13624_cov_40.078226_15_plen_52_part_00